MDKDSINEKLDTLTLEILDCYDQILNKRSLLNSNLDDAYLNLSKARSLIGCASLSIMQVPSELEPNVTVNELETDAICPGNNEIKYKEITYDLVVQSKQKTSDHTDNKQPIPSLPTWFGVLTPLSLKASQKMFSQSLYTIKSICELQTKLNSLQKSYFDLKKTIA